MRSWKILLAPLALLALLQGCNWGNSPGGGTEGEGISGIVVDPQGNAIANARVRVFPDTGSGLAKILATLEAIPDSARTDARGRYRFDSLPAGDYALLARIVRNDSTLTVLVRGIRYAGGERDLGVITLKASGGLLIVVRSGESRSVVTGARCSIQGLEGFEATSDASGACVFEGLPEGDFRVTASHPVEGTAVGGITRVRAGLEVDGGEIQVGPDGPGPIDTTIGPVDTTVAPGAQELSLAVEADAYVNRSSTPEGVHLPNNFGAVDGLLVGVYDLNTIPTSLLRFDLPSNLASARIVKAVLRIHSFGWTDKNVSPPSVTVKLHRVLRAWKEGVGNGSANSALVDGVTALERSWGAQDGAEDWSTPSIGFNDVDASAAVIASATRPNLYLGAWDFDVTSLAKAWAGAPAQNFGVLLRVDVPASNPLVEDYPAFHSRESPVADSLKPRLILTVTPE